MNISNSDNVIGTSKLPHSKAKTYIPFNTLINSQQLTDKYPSVSINNEIKYQNNISKNISSHQNSAQIIDHTCDDNGINIVNTEEGADLTSIHYINEINVTSMNDNENYIHEYYAQFYYQRTVNMYFQQHNMIQQNEGFVGGKTLFWI